MDLKQFSKSDPWFDLNAYVKDETRDAPDTGTDPSAAKPVGKKETGKKSATSLQHPLITRSFVTVSTKVKPYRSPLVLPNGPELVSMVTEHEDNLFEIWTEVAAFIQKLTDQLSNKRLKHPVTGR